MTEFTKKIIEKFEISITNFKLLVTRCFFRLNQNYLVTQTSNNYVDNVLAVENTSIHNCVFAISELIFTKNKTLQQLKVRQIPLFPFVLSVNQDIILRNVKS